LVTAVQKGLVSRSMTLRLHRQQSLHVAARLAWQHIEERSASQGPIHRQPRLQVQDLQCGSVRILRLELILILATDLASLQIGSAWLD